MKTKKLKIILVSGGILIALVAVFLFFQFRKSPAKTAYIDLKQLYNGFEMKKELERKLNAVQNTSSNYLDSLGLQLKVLEKKLNDGPADPGLKDELNEKKRILISKKGEIEEKNRQLAGEFDQQIWNQLNQYVADFGEKYHYGYIFGVQGTGSIMYASRDNNITTEVTNYVNQRYHGKK